MQNRRITIENCCGCGMCSMICQRNAINICYQTGFPLPTIDENKCVKCGKCYDFCPTHFDYKLNDSVLAYRGWSLNEKNRLSCTSGGIAFEIAHYLVENGYKYMGVKFNAEKMCAENYTTEKLEELEASKGSKYITSHTMPALGELKERRKWVVFGTPCQIAAIDNYAKKEHRRDDFILVDMFCAGPATEKLLVKYVEEECKKDKKELNDVVDVRFRDKSKFGWSSTMRIEYADGTTNRIVEKNKSMFYRLFYSGATAKDSCYSCMYAKNISQADIRLGDYSGKKYEGDKKGVSVVLVFTEAGKNVIDRLIGYKIYLEETTEDDINSSKLAKPKFKPRQRKKIINALDTTMTLDEIDKKYVRQIIFERRVKNKIKQILNE